MRQTPPSDRPPANFSRRTVLSLGPVCLAATLTACATPDKTTPASAHPNQPAPGVKPSSGTDATAAQMASTAPRSLTTTDAVPIGGGVVVSGIVVVQPFPGLFKAFDAQCPHLAAIVSPPKDGVITCNVHGSKFVDVDGSLIQGPAPRGLNEIPITVEGNQIFTE
jgi:Rieske Fe-S protein